MPSVSTGADAYQDLDRIRQRIDYDADQFFQDNEQLRFDELLVELERESRGIFETLWGDQTPLEEIERVDTFRTTDDAAIRLVYPIQQIREVEHKQSVGDDWETLDAEYYDASEHSLILASRDVGQSSLRRHESTNRLSRFAARGTWRDLAVKLRVTYDRGFTGGAPSDILNIQIQMIQNALGSRKMDQTTAAAAPDELAQLVGESEMLTEDLRARISDVTSPGKATLSI